MDFLKRKIRHVPDGRLEVVAEGEADAVIRFERAIRHGPSGARVEDVLTELLEPGGLHTFSIKA